MISSELISRFIVEAEVDSSARAASATSIVDTFAVMVAGGAEDAVLTLARSLPNDYGSQAVPSIWTTERYRPDDAALLYGMAAHVLDYDDVSMLAICHPTAPVLAALLCAVPWSTLSGRALCEALAIGTEVMIRIGQDLGFRHYELGFHATATLGVLGATAAVARVRGYDKDDTANSLALAASLSSGLKQNFGSMAKSLQVGVAAANSIRAANWTRAGIRGSDQDIFGGNGFVSAFSGGANQQQLASEPLGDPFVIASPGFARKRYPCCYMLHKMIAATLGLREEHHLDLASVVGARVQLPVGGLAPLIHPRPRSGMQALFSGQYAVLAALKDGKVDFGTFTDQAVGRLSIQRALGAVEIVETGPRGLAPSAVDDAPVTVTLRLADGRSVQRTCAISPGSAGDPLSARELAAKWADCFTRASPRLITDSAARLFGLSHCLSSTSSVVYWIDEISGALRGEPYGVNQRVRR